MGLPASASLPASSCIVSYNETQSRNFESQFINIYTKSYNKILKHRAMNACVLENTDNVKGAKENYHE